MSKKQEILKHAERRVREGGYNNFSFRDLANDVGIKSASVHYHFPTKEDLGAELAALYTQSFLSQLGEPVCIEGENGHPLVRYIEAFRNALTIDRKMCLCGLFGAEIAGLPDKVRLETQIFFEKNIQWLTQAYVNENQVTAEDAKKAAVRLVSLLEGAMLVSNAMSDLQMFELAIQDLQQEIVSGEE